MPRSFRKRTQTKHRSVVTLGMILSRKGGPMKVQDKYLAFADDFETDDEEDQADPSLLPKSMDVNKHIDHDKK